MSREVGGKRKPHVCDTGARTPVAELPPTLCDDIVRGMDGWMDGWMAQEACDLALACVPTLERLPRLCGGEAGGRQRTAQLAVACGAVEAELDELADRPAGG